jgi:NADP-dependent 3-hydroxy acid dehydrogenase YdfG
MPENKQQIMKLQNKIAVITGGSSGIGLATAKELNQNGARVVIVGRNAEAVNKAASELGGDTLGVTADVMHNTRLCDDIYDLEEYLFVSKFHLNSSYQSKHDPIYATNQFQAR